MGMMCESCGILINEGRIDQHINSIYHKNSSLIRDMLDQDKTFTEIGERVGVSRERIRQLTLKYASQTGNERLATRYLNMFKRKSIDKLLGRFTKQLDARQIPYEYFRGIKEKFFSRSLFVNGKNIRLSKASFRNIQGREYLSISTCLVPFDFRAIETPDKRWFIFPCGVAPVYQTSFVYGRDNMGNTFCEKVTGPHSTRHDYIDYLDAFPLLVEKINEKS
jgi:hypothetical protein